MPAEIEGCELHVADGELFGGGVECGRQDRNAVILRANQLFADTPGGRRRKYLQHMQQRRLASIVEAEEEELSVLVGEAERGENIPDCGGLLVTR